MPNTSASGQNQQNQELRASKAKELRQQAIVGIVVVAILIGMIAAIGITALNATNAENQKKAEQAQQSRRAVQRLTANQKPKYANEMGGILISKNGYNTTAPNAPTIAVYADPLCPGCGNFNRDADQMLIAMMKAGQINLELHPMSFLDEVSSDHYSTRVTGAIAYISSNDDNPLHLLQFINNIFAETFQPEEGQDYKPVSNEKLIEQAVNAGVSTEVASKAFDRNYLAWQKAINADTPNREALWNVSGKNKGAMTTPTTTINGKLLDMNAVSDRNLSTPDAILKSIGLDKSKVGVEGVMPKVTDKDQPNPIN
ncbi:thioredoxin domain-containing protein [Bifidobacterium sp. UMB1197]|uniref:DsbA family protein n=1 Tax=Gardnerella vaginalis TaxID=2702 RepID=UPI0039EE6039|nr:thioredoxin domain-containing protein [Bifidobacterium sp. UMB1197]